MNKKYEKRLQLFQNTVACERTDRVLLAPYITYLPITMYGETTIKDTVADWRNALPSYERYHDEFQPDLACGPKSIFPGSAMEALDCQFVRWPGRHFPDENLGFQIVDKEYMAQEEYLEYAEDPTGFMMRKVLPRHYAKLKGLELLDFSNAVWHGGMYATLPMLNPLVQETISAMTDCAQKLAVQVGAANDYFARLAEKGFPSGSDYVTSAPFDVINDTLRGFLNVTMDIYECPDELLEAVKAATKMQVRALRNMIKSRPMRIIGFMLHNGFDNFMSRENFETFYWPGLKECIDLCVENNVVPWIYVEDSYMSKLDILERDVPAGKVMFTFTGTNDMKAIKERFGNKYCLRGGIEASLLQYGNREDVVRAVKEAIDIYAPGGGYILDCRECIDVAKPENMHAFLDTAREYMKY